MTNAPTSHARTITAVDAALRAAFADLDRWFDAPRSLLDHRPAQGWSVPQVLDHVELTNHFLLLTLGKQVRIATRRAAAAAAAPVPDGESDLARLDVIGQRGTFDWPRPSHMEPTGRPLAVVRDALGRQRDQCLSYLEALPAGRGSLCRVTMSVNGLGKIDLYQWLYFIAQHARRHGQQLSAIAAESAAHAAGQ